MKKGKRLVPGGLATWFNRSMDSRWRHGMLLWSSELPHDMYCGLCGISSCRMRYMLIEVGRAAYRTVCDSMIVFDSTQRRP